MMHTPSMIADQAVPDRSAMLHYANELDEIANDIAEMAAMLHLMKTHEEIEPETRAALGLVADRAHQLRKRSESAARGYSEEWGFNPPRTVG